MAVLHSSLAGSDLHEPKGVAAAPAGSVYRANGGGSGTWSYPEVAFTATALNANDITTTVVVPVAHSGTVLSLVLSLGGSISSNVVVDVMDAGGVSIATVNIPSASSGVGTTVTTPLSATVTGGSHLRLKVTTAATESTRIYPSFKLRFL